jgi:hypothetical protein
VSNVVIPGPGIFVHYRLSCDYASWLSRYNLPR